MSDVARVQPITEVAAGLGISRDHLQLYGDDKAKIALEARAGKPLRGRLVLVSAITPTDAGEGKTTTSASRISPSRLWARARSRAPRRCAAETRTKSRWRSEVVSRIDPRDMSPSRGVALLRRMTVEMTSSPSILYGTATAGVALGTTRVTQRSVR